MESVTLPTDSDECILVVDDEPANLDMLTRRLAKRGFTTAGALSVEEARKAVGESMPSLILLDIMMPGESGLDYLKELRSQQSTLALPVILVSALGETEDVVAGLVQGANDYVTKPINFKVLMARVETQLSIGRLMRKLERRNAMLAELAALDELTQIYNRRMGLDVFGRLIRSGAREKQPLSVAMLDIDHFKKVNDEHGHLAGDAVLVEFARRISNCLRPGDVLFRYGGEEFAVLLPNTPLENALGVCERLREAVGRKAFVFEEKSIAATVSAGVTCLIPTESSHPRDWLELADKALYSAKGEGRNRVCSIG